MPVCSIDWNHVSLNNFGHCLTEIKENLEIFNKTDPYDQESVNQNYNDIRKLGVYNREQHS